MFDPVSEPESGPPPGPPRVLIAQRAAALAEVLVCSGFPTQVFLFTLLSTAGMRVRTPAGLLSPAFVFTLSLLDTLVVLALVLFFLHSHRERPRDVLLGWRPVRREIVVGIGLLPVVFLLLLGILGIIFVVAPWLHNVPRNPLEDMLQNRRDAALFAVVATLAGGVREEVQRGFILHRFDHYLGGGWVGLIAYSVLFGLGHIEQGYDAAIAIALLGAVWGAVFLARRSIVAPLVSHAGFNLTQLLKFAALR